MTLLKQEWKMNLKSLVIWTLCVGICCSGCILMFESLEESMAEMGQMFAELGSFSAAFGMDKMSIATLTGFYATEISIIFLLCSYRNIPGYILPGCPCLRILM